MVNEDFLKKVYDKYLSTDFKVGDSDLNPKREISLETDNLKKAISQIENEIRERFEEIKVEMDKSLSYKLPSIKDQPIIKEEVGSLVGQRPPRPQSLRDLVSLSGGHLLVAPGLDISDPLSVQLEKYLYMASIFGDGAGSTDKNTMGEFIDLPEIEKPDCSDAAEDPFKENLLASPPNIQYGICIEEFNCLTNGKEGGILENSKEVQFALEHKGYCSKCWERARSQNTSNGQFPSVGEGGNSQSSSNPSGKGRSNFHMPCVVDQLKVLQMILLVVRIIKEVERTVMVTLSIAIPIAKIVTKCSQAWVSPPAVSEAIALIQEALIALMIDVFTTLLVTLWNLLQLDCLTSIAKDIKREILAILTAIEEIGKFGDSISLMAKDVKDAWDEAGNAIETANNKTIERMASAKSKKEKLNNLKKDIKALKAEIKRDNTANKNGIDNQAIWNDSDPEKDPEKKLLEKKEEYKKLLLGIPEGSTKPPIIDDLKDMGSNILTKAKDFGKKDVINSLSKVLDFEDYGSDIVEGAEKIKDAFSDDE